MRTRETHFCRVQSMTPEGKRLQRVVFDLAGKPFDMLVTNDAVKHWGFTVGSLYVMELVGSGGIAFHKPN